MYTKVHWFSVKAVVHIYIYLLSWWELEENIDSVPFVWHFSYYFLARHGDSPEFCHCEDDREKSSGQEIVIFHNKHDVTC